MKTEPEIIIYDADGFVVKEERDDSYLRGDGTSTAPNSATQEVTYTPDGAGLHNERRILR